MVRPAFWYRQESLNHWPPGSMNCWTMCCCVPTSARPDGRGCECEFSFASQAERYLRLLHSLRSTPIEVAA